MEDIRVYDCFSYFNEDMLLELRLETLWDHVDIFVISEATYTHRGLDRKLLFDINNFKKYASKIRYCPLDRKPEGPNDFWKNENYVRNNVMNGLWDCRDNDYILISDLDEIPNPDSIRLYDPEYLRGDFVQGYFAYYLNNKWVSNRTRRYRKNKGSTEWLGTKITTFNHFKGFFKSDASSVRIYKSSGPLRSLKREWFKRASVQRLENGGWHFTWALTLNEIKLKMKSGTHVFDDDKYLSDAYLLGEIRSGKDFSDPDKMFVAQTLDANFPRYLLENRDQFKEFLLDISSAG
jgi:beta-1,4-mannosyl-glycoprotein beta-1,4-N-acetylglucosaminyltransferase